jgi:opacity protein-like surface antigen
MREMPPLRPIACLAAVAILLHLAPPSVLAAEAPESQEEKQARLERRGLGFLVGGWNPRDLSRAAGASESETPLGEGYFQKGLDLHLALATSVGYYRRRQKAGSDEVVTHLVPQFTSLKIYPFTRPEQRLEPFLFAGAGLAIGIEEVETTSGGLLGLMTENATNLVPGFGFQAGAGAEWRPGKAFGLMAGGRYQWIRFTDEVGGLRTYQGPGFDLGFTYRFQFR